MWVRGVGGDMRDSSYRAGGLIAIEEGVEDGVEALTPARHEQSVTDYYPTLTLGGANFVV